MGDGYDEKQFKKWGLKTEIQDDGKPHGPSRVPQTGQILKGRKHDTWNKAVEGERKAGMRFFKYKGKYFTRPKSGPGSSNKEALKKAKRAF